MTTPLRDDYDAARLRGEARKTKDAGQARRLLALAAIYERGVSEPQADMVICGPGPNLICALESTEATAGYPNPDRLDHAPIWVVAFSHPLPALFSSD